MSLVAKLHALIPESTGERHGNDLRGAVADREAARGPLSRYEALALNACGS